MQRQANRHRGCQIQKARKRNIIADSPRRSPKIPIWRRIGSGIGGRGYHNARSFQARPQRNSRPPQSTAVDWRKPDGSLKDMSCRVALLRLHREGVIELPAPRRRFEPPRSYAQRTPQGEPGTWLEAPLSRLGTVRLELVERAGGALWNELIDRYHDLGYKPLPGAQLRYFAYASERLVAVFGFGAAAWQTAPRDLRVDVMQGIEALDSVTPPELRPGKFRPPDKLIASLHD